MAIIAHSLTILCMFLSMYAREKENNNRSGIIAVNDDLRRTINGAAQKFREGLAGFLLKKSAKTNGWSRRRFVLNEKTGKQEGRHFHGMITLEDCNLEDIYEEEEAPSKSSKDKKANGLDAAKVPSLLFKLTNKVQYKTVLNARSAVVLKAKSMADKTEWINKLKNVISSKGGQVKGRKSGPPMQQSLSAGSLDTMTRRPADPEELHWMAQEVRCYVEVVLNRLIANVPKASFSFSIKFALFYCILL